MANQDAAEANTNVPPPPNQERAARNENVNAVPEQIARLEGLMEGLQHGHITVLGSHAVIIGAVAIALAVIIGGFTVLWINTDSVATKMNSRIDGLERTISQLPNQLIAIATAIGARQPPVLVTVPTSPPAAPLQAPAPQGTPEKTSPQTSP